MKKLLLILPLVLLLAGCWDTGSGEKIGTIIGVGKFGIFCKTNEAMLVRGGFKGGTGVQGGTFHFTIENPSLVEKALQYEQNQTEVKIKYHTEANSICRSDSSNVFLDDIQPVEHKAESSTSVPSSSPADNPKVIELLKVQAQLIEELVNRGQ